MKQLAPADQKTVVQGHQGSKIPKEVEKRPGLDAIKLAKV